MLVDQHGKPIELKELTREVAAPTVAGVRTIWDETVAAGLTPYRLSSLLRDSIEGDARAYLTLAEEMEERDLHYASVLGTRKLAVSRLPLVVEAASDAEPDQKLASAVRDMIRRPGMRGLLKDLLDGLGKGYSVVEIMWDRSGQQWKPAQLEWRDPRFFLFDRVKRSELRLLDDGDSFEGIPLAPYKFIVHKPRVKSGLAIRNGFARVAAWSYLFKNYTLKDWVAFCEVFGMPLRLGKYPSNARPDQVAILKTAVANLGTDAAAVMPQNMTVDFIESKNSGATTLFKDLAEYLDAQLSKGILGQTATTEGTPGRIGSDEAQSDVRDDIRDDDAEQLAETLNRDLIRPFIDLNFGPQENYPQLQLHIAEPEDVAALVNAVKELVPLGLKVEQSVVRDRIGIPDPGKDVKPEDLLSMGNPLVSDPALNRAGARALNSEQSCCPACSSALNAAETNTPDTPQQIAAKLSGDAAAAMDAMIAPLAELVKSAGSFEELRDGIEALAGQLDIDELGTLMAQAFSLANLAGRAEVADGD